MWCSTINWHQNHSPHNLNVFLEVSPTKLLQSKVVCAGIPFHCISSFLFICFILDILLQQHSPQLVVLWKYIERQGEKGMKEYERGIYRPEKQVRLCMKEWIYVFNVVLVPYSCKLFMLSLSNKNTHHQILYKSIGDNLNVHWILQND